MAFKPEEVCLGMCCYSLKARFRRLGLSGRCNIMIQSILCRYNTGASGGSTNMTLLSTDWICDIKVNNVNPTTSFIIIVTGPLWIYIVHWRWYFPLSEHEYSSEDVEFVSCCKFSLWISVSCFYYHQYYTGTQLTGSVTLNDLSLIHISEPTRRYAISYAVFCLKKKK